MKQYSCASTWFAIVLDYLTHHMSDELSPNMVLINDGNGVLLGVTAVKRNLLQYGKQEGVWYMDLAPASKQSRITSFAIEVPRPMFLAFL